MSSSSSDSEILQPSDSPPATGSSAVPPPVAPPKRTVVPPPPPRPQSQEAVPPAPPVAAKHRIQPPTPPPQPAKALPVSQSAPQSANRAGNVRGPQPPPPSQEANRFHRTANRLATKQPVTAGQRVAERERGKRTVPSWLVSFVFHLALLLVLALIPIPGLMKGSLTLFFGQSDEPGIAEFELGGTDGFDVDLPTEPTLPSFDLVDPSETMETIDLSSLIKSDTPTTAIESLESLQQAIANGLSGRSGANKAALLARWGSPETEDAVELGLEWLAKQQKSNGSWSLIGPYASGGVYENTTAATALALNAFLGAGYTHREGKYSENVTLGLKYLTRRQDRKGFFAEKEPSRQQMYAQAIATITICEALGMTEDYDLLQYAERAIEFAEFSQSRLHGWRYEPQRDADVSVTGWFVMALETGKMAGLTVDEEKLQEVHQFLDSVGYDEMSQYAYNDLEGPSLSMTAEGMLIRILLGWPKSHPALLDAVQEQFVPTRPQADDEEQSIYYWYYATQVMHHFGGEPWEIWNQAMKSAIPAMQQKSGPEKGSWDPARDIYGASGGRLYTTCLSIYCLEVYYRHLAIYGTE